MFLTKGKSRGLFIYSLILLFVVCFVFSPRINKKDATNGNFHLFPDYLEPAFAYLVTDGSKPVVMYNKTDVDFGKVSFLEGVIDSYYQSYGGIECPELYRIRLGKEIPNGFDLDELIQELNDNICLCRDNQECISIVGISQFEHVDTSGNIYGSDEIYHIELYDEKWFILKNDMIIFMANKGSGVLKAIIIGWENQDPSGGSKTILGSYNITY